MLSDGRTALLNAIGLRYLSHGKPLAISLILESLAEEVLQHFDSFIDELNNMTDEQLFDLGFNYLETTSRLMLFPVWMYVFIPDDAILYDIEGNEYCKRSDDVSVYGNHWLDVGFYRNFEKTT